MSASSIDDEVLHVGIHRHICSLFDEPSKAEIDINMVDKIALKPKELLFDVNTCKRTVEKAVKELKEEKRREELYQQRREMFEEIRAKHKPNDMRIFVGTLTGKTMEFNLNADYTVDELKILIQEKEGIPAAQRCICYIYGGKQLEDGRTLKDYNIQNDATIHMVIRFRGGGCSAYELEKNSFATKWNYDFTKIPVDKYPFSRGGSLYVRPHGSMRYALKVFGKYENDDWLGLQRNRYNENSSLDTEWPVAYHGTTDPRATKILQSGGFNMEKGVRFLYGHGIYCTPDPETALAYATEYEHKGHHYKLILQTRVDPARRDIVPKSKHRVAGLDDYWIAKENDAIRPYGICVYPILR